MRLNPPIEVSAVVLTNDDGEVALVRKHHTTALIFPGGKPEPGETGRAAAARELHEELGVAIATQDFHHVGDYTTPAANEANTELLSQVYTAQLPAGQHARAQAEIAQMWWVDPAALAIPDGYQLAPLSSRVLQQLAEGKVPDITGRRPVLMEMTMDEFETLVGEVLDSLDDAIVGGLDNLIFVIEDRPADRSMDVLGYYEGYDRDARADYGFGQLPDQIVLFREPLLAACDDEHHLRHESG